MPLEERRAAREPETRPAFEGKAKVIRPSLSRRKAYFSTRPEPCRQTSTPISDGHSLEYRGFRFELRVEPVRGGYQPNVVLVRTPADEEEMHLPNDTEEVVYGTEAEATRHAEQQSGYRRSDNR